MPDRPLLLFPMPEIAACSSRAGYPNDVRKPSYNRQRERLSPIFQALQTAFDQRRVEIQPSATGVDPEQVLVIETIGTVDRFANAVTHIEGFEWMGEIETDEIAPDEDFCHGRKGTKNLSGRFYMVMSNQQALEQMISLWERYRNDEDMHFDHGLAKFRDIFRSLKNIRQWSVQDRIEETGLLDVWQADLQLDRNQEIPFEVQLWFRGSTEKQCEAQKRVELLVENLGGEVKDDCLINDIAYHALLVTIPAVAAQEIIQHHDIELIKCDHVMFFRPVGQMTTGKGRMEGDLSDQEHIDADIPSGDPIVAILDGLPLANHELLRNRLIIDDPDDDYASIYPAQHRIHGTTMASLIIHGDLSDGDAPLPRPVYVRPVMKPHPERIPNDVLVVDCIHRAVLGMFEGEEGRRPSAPTIRIINFSIGDPCSPFSQAMSPLARLLDWLSFKYRVLFIISAGNHSQDVRMNMSKEEFQSLTNSDKEATVVRTLYSDARHRRILSPGESINGITVGALHQDSATVTNTQGAFNPFERILPSPISAYGGGYRKAVKPDLLYSGGRVLCQEPYETSTCPTYKIQDYRNAPGNKVASPSSDQGELGKASYCCGTSNASALISRLAATSHETLLEVFEEQAPNIELAPYLAPLLKTMLIHGCSWGEIEPTLRRILQTSENGHQMKSLISRWLGYGVPDNSRVMECTEQRATLLGFGELQRKEAHVFTLPLPTSLSAHIGWRRLTVTLAWISPIAANTQKYRTAGLWFEVNDNNNVIDASSRVEVGTKASRRGTVQHEVFEGKRAAAVTEDLKIKVNCKEDAAKIHNSVPYGLAVTLEVAEEIDIAIYEEVRTRIMLPVQIPTIGED